jgi:hypothetical protein
MLSRNDAEGSATESGFDEIYAMYQPQKFRSNAQPMIGKGRAELVSDAIAGNPRQISISDGVEPGQAPSCPVPIEQ